MTAAVAILASSHGLSENLSLVDTYQEELKYRAVIDGVFLTF